MDGFRNTTNLSLVNSNISNDSNVSTSCGGSDETEQAVLVSVDVMMQDHAGPSHTMQNTLLKDNCSYATS